MVTLGIWTMDTGKQGGRDNGKHVSVPHGHEVDRVARRISQSGQGYLGSWLPGCLWPYVSVAHEKTVQPGCVWTGIQVDRS
jgi:hypothetical protein